MNDTVMALNRQKKPSGNDQPKRYWHLSAILAALQGLEKLICTNAANGSELRDCLYS